MFVNGGPSPTPAAPNRTLGRRRALPTGRAVTGAFAIAVAVVIVLSAFVTDGTHGTRSWVVTTGPLAAGTRLNASVLTTQRMALGAVPAAAAFAVPADLAGRTLAVALPAGALVVAPELAAPGGTTTLRPLPVTVAPADLVDLGAGDLVDVLVTAGSAPTTSIVARGAVVLSTVQPSTGLLGGSGGDVVTLGLATLAEVQAVVAAEHAGTVNLAVGEPSDGAGLGPVPPTTVAPPAAAPGTTVPVPAATPVSTTAPVAQGRHARTRRPARRGP